MKALINTLNNQIILVTAGYFEVALPLMWVECAKDVHPRSYFYDGKKLVPKPNVNPAISSIGAEHITATAMAPITHT